VVGFGFAWTVCFVTHAVRIMKASSDASRVSMQLPTDSGVGATITGGAVPERPNHAERMQYSAGPGWDPYEVWCTKVRAVQLANVSNQHNSSRNAKRERKERPWDAYFSGAARNAAHIFASVVTLLNIRGALHLLRTGGRPPRIDPAEAAHPLGRR
jgi:hypothetical protein